VVGVLSPLDEPALIEILTRPKNALTKQYKKLFQMEDVELVFDESAVRAIARIAKQRETGARGLRAVMEETMLHLMYDIPSRTDVRKVVISEDTILKHAAPEVVAPARSQDKRSLIGSRPPGLHFLLIFTVLWCLPPLQRERGVVDVTR
jgi:ATP-dependent Clp protease ATP-binding subunit ClpX